MKMINVYVFAFCILASLTVAGQKHRYKDIAPALDTTTTSEQMMSLRAYLLDDPDQPNANFRLALLHYNTFRKADPLLEYKKAIAHAKQAILLFTKAKVIVTASDVKGDNEYYAPLFKTVDSKGKPFVEFTLVQQKMITAMDSAQRFVEKMPPIYKAFTRSVRQYDQAVKTFAAINTDYKTLEDIYMLFDASLDQRLDLLKNSYDSAIVYFNNYQSLIADYPLKKYNQKSHVRSISVYRMDGLLTALSFLTPDVEFWNYSEWVEGVRKAHRDQIVPLKDKIASTELKVNESLTRIPANTVSPVEELAKVSKDLIFQLNNYDKNSLALALLEYKAFKQGWLLKQKSIATDTALDSRLQLYSNLIQLNRGADTLITHVKNAATDINVKKHQAFLEKYYSGANGLKTFIDIETALIENSFKDYRETLQTNLRRYNPNPEGTNKFVKINNFNVPLFIDKKSVDQLDNMSMLTQRIARLPDGSVYVSGVHKMNKKTNNNLTVFVTRLNADGKPAWLKELNFSPDSLATLDASNYVGDMVTTQEGCALVVTSARQTSGPRVNNFVFLNDKGEIKSIRLKDAATARKMVYQESSNSFVVVFKGSAEKQQYQVEEPLAISSINVLGDLLWRQDIALTGTFQDLIPVRDGYVVTGNYGVMKDQNGREVRTKIAQGQSNPFLIKINLKGDRILTLPLTSDRSIVIDKVVKVNDGSINLLGFEGTFGQDTNGLKGSPMHLMTAFDLRMICSTF
jgi:hypothetical protein